MKIGNFLILNLILSKNFNNIANSYSSLKRKNLKIIDNFEHNFISLFNGKLVSSDFSHETKDKISLEIYNYKNKKNLDKKNPLNFLNQCFGYRRLFIRGFQEL